MKDKNEFIYVKPLDKGFVTKHDGKTEAISDFQQLYEKVNNVLVSGMQPLKQIGVHNCSIKIEISYNNPEQAG